MAAVQDSAEHLAPVPHAGAAVDHQFVRRKIGGEIVSLDMTDVQLSSDILRQPAGDFNSADIFAYRVMEKQDVSNENAIPCLQSIYGQRPMTWFRRSPLKRANRIEKLVKGTPEGVSAATFRNAWESVMTSRGGFLS